MNHSSGCTIVVSKKAFHYLIVQSLTGPPSVLQQISFGYFARTWLPFSNVCQDRQRNVMRWLGSPFRFWKRIGLVYPKDNWIMGLCASRNKVPVETTATATATAESKPKGRYFLGNRGRSSSSPETRHSTGGEYASSMSARSGTHSQSNTTGRASTSSSMKKGSFSEKENSSYPSPGSPNVSKFNFWC